MNVAYPGQESPGILLLRDFYSELKQTGAPAARHIFQNIGLKYSIYCLHSA